MRTGAAFGRRGEAPRFARGVEFVTEPARPKTKNIAVRICVFRTGSFPYTHFCATSSLALLSSGRVEFDPSQTFNSSA